MEVEILENGITKEQSRKAREILKEAGIRKVAKIICISEMTIHNVLRGDSPNIEILEKAIITAKEITAAKKRKIENLPV